MARKNFNKAAVLPAPVIETYEGFIVVRDDLLEGGSKRRALAEILTQIAEHEIVYPATAHGYGQLALALACRDVDKQAKLFVAARKNMKDAPLVTQSINAGADYTFVPFPNFMNVVCARAKTYAETTGAYLMPLGFKYDAFSDALTKVARSLPVTPEEVWVSGGTGTLARAFAKAWPSAQINVVSNGMKNFSAEADNIIVWQTPEKFAQKAKNPPPYPSAPHYDAKVWQFAKKHGRKGALIWNVGA